MVPLIECPITTRLWSCNGLTQPIERLGVLCAAVNVHMPKDRVTSQHQNFGFVEFLSEDDAE
jgi:RNA recognition motif-containing protein